MNIIKELKLYAIDKQKYEFAARVRDIEREIASASTYEHEIPEYVFELIQKLTKESFISEEDKKFMQPLLREFKLNQILKKPLD